MRRNIRLDIGFDALTARTKRAWRFDGREGIGKFVKRHGPSVTLPLQHRVHVFCDPH
jgi:hypothetical protein